MPHLDIGSSTKNQSIAYTISNLHSKTPSLAVKNSPSNLVQRDKTQIKAIIRYFFLRYFLCKPHNNFLHQRGGTQMPKQTVHPLNSYIHIHFPQSPQSHLHPRKSLLDIKKWENHAMGSQFGNIWEIRPQKFYLRSNPAFQKQFYKKDLIFDKKSLHMACMCNSL